MLIYDQFGIIQNLQTLPTPQTSFLVGTFIAASYSKTALAWQMVGLFDCEFTYVALMLKCPTNSSYKFYKNLIVQIDHLLVFYMNFPSKLFEFKLYFTYCEVSSFL